MFGFCTAAWTLCETAAPAAPPPPVVDRNGTVIGIGDSVAFSDISRQTLDDARVVEVVPRVPPTASRVVVRDRSGKLLVLVATSVYVIHRESQPKT